MSDTNLIPAFIVNYLQRKKLTRIETDYQVITFFDRQYPAVLTKSIFMLPVIYYRGNISLLDNCCGAMISNHPSYYVARTIGWLKLDYNLISIDYHPNSISNHLYLCDIIYCNDISTSQQMRAKLQFSFKTDYSALQQAQIITVLIKKLFVLEGYPNQYNFELVSNAFDNAVEVSALPTNIYIKDGSLPNILISNGVTPLILNEK